MVSIAVLLVAAGIWFIIAFLLEKIRAHAYAAYPTTDGVITSLEMVERKGITRTTTWAPKVMFTYKIGDQIFSGNRLTFTRVVVEDKTAAKIRELFAVGNPVKVFYNPRKPADSVLNPNGADLKNRLVLGVVLVLVGLGLGLILLTNGI
jgi:hypothetical protein